jgi:hypothetical protein
MKEHEAQMPKPRARLAEAAERLVQLYETWGKADEAVKWRKELEAAKEAASRVPASRPSASPAGKS